MFLSRCKRHGIAYCARRLQTVSDPVLLTWTSREIPQSHTREYTTAQLASSTTKAGSSVPALMSCPSAVAPLQLRYQNNTVNANGGAITNGVAIQLGTPAQLFSLTPSLLLNNTYINNAATCGDTPNNTCLSIIGGAYSPEDSSSYRTTTADAFNGSQEYTTDSLIGVPALYFNDLLTISASQLLPGFPLLVQTGASFYGGLGLGKNSTFINRLVEAAFAPSRSFSLFTGVYSDIGAGSLIIGGYANRFYEGQLYAKNVTDAEFCPACFEVSSMEYSTATTSVQLLPNGTESFTAELDPYYPVLIMPEESFYRFGNATNGTLNEGTYAYEYPGNHVPDGNITITLENGLKTVIPSMALFNPPAYDNGILADGRNNSVVYGMVQPWRAYNDLEVSDIGVFGIPYTAFVYIIRDYERGQLQIANANQAASIGGDATTICPLDREINAGSSSHTGSIAGGVVGGTIGLLLVAVLAWLLWRRKKRNGKTSRAGAQASPSAGTDSGHFLKSELPTYDAVHRSKNEPDMPATDINSPQELSAKEIRRSAELPDNRTATTSETLADTTLAKEMPANEKAARAEVPA